ncbi:MAG: translation initiation factor IF-3 [Verrucomicrobiota bacterium]
MSRPFTPRNYSTAPQHRLNGKIRAREIRVIGVDNQQIGVHSLTDALRMAQNLGVDLVEIAAQAVPPVCRLVDYGKFRYEESKKQKKSSESARIQLKEIQLRPGIAENDYNTKITHAREFLEEGLPVKAVMRLRGREMRHPEIGQKLMEKLVADLAAFGRTDAAPKRVERNINVMLRPLPRQQRGKPAGSEREVNAAPTKPATPLPAPVATPPSTPEPNI